MKLEKGLELLRYRLVFLRKGLAFLFLFFCDHKDEILAEGPANEWDNESGMEWNDECVMKFKKKRILPTWILEGKKSNHPDTEKHDSAKAEKLTAEFKEMFKRQKQKKNKENEKNKNSL